MPVHYDGRDLKVLFGAADISAYARSITVDETAPEPDELETTHKGDTEKQTIEGLAGAQSCSANFTMIDIYDAITVFGSMEINSIDTLFVFPKGQVVNYPQLTLQNARLTSRSQPIEYNGVVEISGTFNARNSLTRSTCTG
jgi:hypothetical protein